MSIDQQYQQSYAILLAETAAIQQHAHAQMVQAHRELMRRIFESRDLIAESRECIAEADRVLGGTHR